MRNEGAVVLAILLIMNWTSQGLSLTEQTHKDINEYIAQNIINGFSLNRHLIDNLGFSSGIKENLEGLTLLEHFQRGESSNGLDMEVFRRIDLVDTRITS